MHLLIIWVQLSFGRYSLSWTTISMKRLVIKVKLLNMKIAKILTVYDFVKKYYTTSEKLQFTL